MTSDTKFVYFRSGDVLVSCRGLITGRSVPLR